MKTQYKNLNEQISRMKSLFTEERLYGNLVEQVTPAEVVTTPPASIKGEPTIGPNGNYIINYTDGSVVIYAPEEKKWKKKADAASDMVEIDITTPEGQNLVKQYEATRNGDKKWKEAEAEKEEAEGQAAEAKKKFDNAMDSVDAFEQGWVTMGKELKPLYDENPDLYTTVDVKHSDGESVFTMYKRGTLTYQLNDDKRRKCRQVISDNVKKYSKIRKKDDKDNYIVYLPDNSEVDNEIEKIKWCIYKFGEDKKDARFLKKDRNTIQFIVAIEGEYGVYDAKTATSSKRSKKVKPTKQPKGKWYPIDRGTQIKYDGGDDFIIKSIGTVGITNKAGEKVFRGRYAGVVEDVLTQGTGDFNVDGEPAYKSISNITVDDIKKGGKLIKITVTGN